MLVLALSPAAGAGEPDAWLDALYRRVAADVRGGKPLVATVHVALCSSDILRCGGHGLGDGDSLRTNLYWATTGGFDGWFSRRDSGWRRVHVERPTRSDVLETVVWERRIDPGLAWRGHGVTRPFSLYVVAHAWRGAAIDAAVDAFVEDLYGDGPKAIELERGRNILAGGASHLVAFIGHDRFMDRPPYDFAAVARRAGRATRPKGLMAVACATVDYLAAEAAPRRVPLVLTTDLMFASSPAFEHAVRAFAGAEDYAGIRRAAAEGYAAEQHKPVARCQSLFTNPSNPRWPR